MNKTWMSPRERVLAVIQRQEPDRVPHFEWSFDAPIVRALTKNGTNEDLIEILDIDAIMTGADYRSKQIDSRTSIDEWGITQVKGLMDHKIPLDEKAPIRSMKDLNDWEPPDPFDPQRLNTLKRYVKRFKEKRAIFIYVRDVWSLPRDLMGYMDLMVACIERPEIVNGIIEKGMEHNIKIVEQAVELGADLVFSGDDIADNRNTLISPKMWENLFAPHFKKLIAAFHSLGLLHWKHSDGNIMPVLDSLIDAGIDGIDPIDPLGGMSLEIVKERYGDKVAIKGNVDCTKALVNGTKEDLIEEVKDCIRIAAPGGGYVCSSSNSIHSGVNPEYYRLMVETIHEYGTYPLDFDLLEKNKNRRIR